MKAFLGTRLKRHDLLFQDTPQGRQREEQVPGWALKHGHSVQSMNAIIKLHIGIENGEIKEFEGFNIYFHLIENRWIYLLISNERIWKGKRKLKGVTHGSNINT